ncbi:MAG: type IV secretion system DNA-binding domain-containing protein, partial [Terriglobales bacterium]
MNGERVSEPGTAFPSVAERLTDQFYRWELRGRGWTVWPEPVDLEPPYRPFLGHYVPSPAVVDDGRFETGWSRFATAVLKKLGKPEEPPAPPPLEEEEEEPGTQAVTDREGLVELQAVLPAELDIPREAFAEFLASLHLCREAVTFELLGRPAAISAQFVAHPTDAPLVRQQLQAFFPDAVFLPQRDYLARAWGGGEPVVVEVGLGREFMRPLASGRLDPFVGIVGALSELGPEELGLFQVMFQPVRHAWAESILRAVKDGDGESFFANAPELVKQAEEKVASPLYAVAARIATQAPEFDRAWEIARHLAGSMRVFAHPTGNELIPLENDGYPFEAHVADVLRRQCRRCGMILNAEELIGFAHLPQSAVRAPKLARQAVKTKTAPKSVLAPGGLTLGENVHAGRVVPVALTPEQRVRHVHVVGTSGTGKSTLLFNMIRQDIERGHGVAVLDPHGDLVDRVLGIIPERRLANAVLLDPADEEYSIGFNVLSAHSELEKRLLASDLVSVFQRLSTSWGDQMGSVLRNGILAFLESREGGTLADLRRFLLEPAFRERFLESVGDPEIVYYWRKGFPQLGGNKSIGPVITRL